MKRLFKIFGFFLLLTPAFAIAQNSYENMNQNVFGQIKESPYDKPSKKDKEQSKTLDEIEYKDNKNLNGYLGGGGDTEWLGKNYEDEDRVSFQGKKANINSYDNKELAKKYSGKGKNALAFTYLYDTYDYFDSKGAYNSIFKNENSAKSIQSGYLTFSYKRKFISGRLSLLGDLSLAVSYASGKGSFEDSGELSRTTFQFWTVPLEYMLGARVSMGPYIDLNIFGGPAIAFIIQNRNDREDGSPDKKIQQFGYGYSAYGSLDVSLTRMNPDYAIELKNSSDITDLSVSLVAKTTSLGNFKDEDFEISGVSFGLSFNFEYL